MLRFLRHLPLALALINSSLHAATLPASEDTYSLKGKLTVATNKATTLPVDGTRHAFIFFDLTDIPAGAQIRYARLRLYFPSVVRAGAGLTLHTVTGQWNEGVASAEPAFDSTPLITFAPTAVGAKRFVSVDVTDTVKAWLTNPASNEGFAIAAVAGATAKLTASATIGSKEGSGSGYPAELEVELSAVPGLITSEQLAPDLTLGGTTAGTFSGNAAALTALTAGNITGQLTTTQIGSGAVQQGNIGNGAVGNAQLALGAVQSGNIANGAVGNSQFASNLTLAGTTTGTFSGDGSALTGLNASNLASGTVPNARVNGTYSNALKLPNTSNMVTGIFTASGDADFQNNLLKDAVPGSILYHASFQGVAVNGGGGKTAGDGFISLQATLNNDIEVRPNPTGILQTLDKPGHFISATIRCGDGQDPEEGHSFLLSVGSGGATPYGFGFKMVGNALKGFTSDLVPGGTTLVDLATTVLGQTVEHEATQFNLLAIRRAASVEFYVNGILKGTSTTNLPTEFTPEPTGYVLQLKNSGVTNSITIEVGGLTVGVPMF